MKNVSIDYFCIKKDFSSYTAFEANEHSSNLRLIIPEVGV